MENLPNNRLFNNIYEIQIPVNGIRKSVQRIRNVKGQILWEIPKTNVTFMDNVPITVTYDNNDNDANAYMDLVPVEDVAAYDNIITKFSSKGYAHTPINIDWRKDTSFELCLKITTGYDVKSRQELFSMEKTESLELEILNGKLHWEKTSALGTGTGTDATGTFGHTTLSPNQQYFVKFTKINKSITVSLSLNGGKTFLDEFIAPADYNVLNEKMFFGVDKACDSPTPIEPFLGQIDLTQSTFLYNNIKYQLRILNCGYITFIRDNAIRVQNTLDGDLIIRGFSTKNYAHSAFAINWSKTNETTIVMHIKTGSDITTRQELFSMQHTGGFELEIQFRKLKWELNDTWSHKNLATDTEYMIIFSKKLINYIIGAIKYTKYKSYIEHNQLIPISEFDAYLSTTVDKECSNEYLYLGIDISGQNDIVEPFLGMIYCKDSYLVYNGKKYNFRI